jgi:Zn-dependent protease
MLEGKPLQARKRMVVIGTGIVGIILILILIYTYAHPVPVKHDPEVHIATGYTTILTKIQSLFHRK